MRRLLRDALPGTWSVPLGYAVLRVAFAPETFNTHAIMYAVIVEAGSTNSLEPFHPLQAPTLALAGALAKAAGAAPLAACQAVSLLGAVAHLALVHRLARRLWGDDRLAALASLLAAASINLWAWSLQTTAYTIATALMLACVDRLLAEEAHGPASAAKLGLWTAAAAGYDTAALVLAPVILADVGNRRGARAAAASYLAALLAGGLAVYAPFLAKMASLGRSADPRAIFRGLPPDIVSIFHSGSLLEQLRLLRLSDAPWDAPSWLFAAFFAGAWLALRARPQARAARAGGLLFAGVLAFFLACDPHNRFLYAAGLLFPALAPGIVPAPRTAWLVGGAALLLLKNAAVPADYLPASNPGFDEARFVASQLGRSDLLLTLSQADWLFSYGVAGRVPVARPAWPEDREPSFRHERVEVPDLAARARRTLCGGGRVLLATGGLFRNPAIPGDRMDRYADTVAESLNANLALGEPLRSPAGLAYYPVLVNPRTDMIDCPHAAQ